MNRPTDAPGPLTAAEAALLETARLSAPSRHQLRLLAHSLRTLQQIAGRRLGPAPEAASIVAWAQGHDLLAGDTAFRAAFCRQLLSSAERLTAIAATLAAECIPAPGDQAPEGGAGDALGLELEQLITWCERQPDQGRVEAG